MARSQAKIQAAIRVIGNKCIYNLFLSPNWYRNNRTQLMQYGITIHNSHILLFQVVNGHFHDISIIISENTYRRLYN